MWAYNFFTHYYDDIVRWEGYSLQDEVDMLDDFIKTSWSFIEKPISILELACGTWVVARELLKKNYDVIWMDISEEMLVKAQDNIWDDRCILWDMTKFNIDIKFDVILCNYNSICHLISFKEWEKLFMQVIKHLKDWGLFIFDINTIWEFENITKDFRSFYNFTDKDTLRNDTVCLEMFKKEFIDKDIHKEHTSKWFYYSWLIKIFKSNDHWSFDLIEEEINENSFEISKITKELNSFWFSIVHMEDFHNWEVDKDSERVYFVCKKVG